MTTRSIAAGLLSAFGATVVLSGQAPQGVSPAPTTAPRSTTPVVGAQSLTSVTLTGCLYNEESVPGRTPNAAEKAGVLEDYILADASLPADAGAHGTLATGNMYKVEKIDDDKLRAMVGKRVEVAGKIDPEGGALGRSAGGPAPDKGLGPDLINLPEFEATSIKEVPGACPATPAPRR